MPRTAKRTVTRARTTSRTRRTAADGAPDSALLRLARDVADLRARDEAARLDAALERIAAAYGRDGDVPRSLFESWLARRRDGRPDKARTLAVAWGREQLRLALQELIEDEARRGRVRAALTADDLAWIVLAGCEALAHEPLGAAADRLRLLLALVGRGDPAIAESPH